MTYTIEEADQVNRFQMLDFLKRHENYTLFLSSNLANYGMKLGTSPYSGNYKLIRSGDEIIGVFYLSRKGTILIETTVREPVFDLVLSSCKPESIPITGLVGRHEFCHSFWEFLKVEKVIREEIFASKEILYEVDLSILSDTASNHLQARFLTESDYKRWKELRLAYLKEEAFPVDLSDAQLQEIFSDKVNRKIIWGFFREEILVSMADLNAKTSDVGQAGGVYTVPEFRQRGYSKAVMQQLLSDCKRIHGIRKLIIFTGENNFPAQKLYASLGVKQIGYYSLSFGKS